MPNKTTLTITIDYEGERELALRDYAYFIGVPRSELVNAGVAMSFSGMVNQHRRSVVLLMRRISTRVELKTTTDD